MARRRRRARRRILFLALIGGLAAYRKRRLDAADADFPGTTGGPG
jgi:hypothetical protein